MVRVLFVCLGNICRSPMAEAVFRDMVEKEGLTDKIEIDSAATSSWEHGNPVHYGTRDKLAEVGISVDGMYSRILKNSDLEADYIVGMDNAVILGVFLKQSKLFSINISLTQTFPILYHVNWINRIRFYKIYYNLFL